MRSYQRTPKFKQRISQLQRWHKVFVVQDLRDGFLFDRYSPTELFLHQFNDKGFRLMDPINVEQQCAGTSP